MTRMPFWVMVLLFISTAARPNHKKQHQSNGKGNICKKYNPCANGALCRNTRWGYICKCPAGWKGYNCDKDIDECANSPCGLGTCKNMNGSFMCTCPSGLSGTYCEKDVDECQAKLCKNGAKCTNTPGSFTCTCDEGYTGSLCDKEIGPLECLQKNDPEGKNYFGTKSVTKSGVPCQRWDSQTPHKHNYDDMDDQENYCRNPEDDDAPWCYTIKTNLHWELCDIPNC